MQDLLLFMGQEWLLFGLLLLLIYGFMKYESHRAGRMLNCTEVIRFTNDGKAVVIDIRDSESYQAGHISGAIHINSVDIDKRSQELEQYKQLSLIIVDKMGQLTAGTAKKLQALGYTTMRLSGGMMSWADNNLPVVKGLKK